MWRLSGAMVEHIYLSSLERGPLMMAVLQTDSEINMNLIMLF